MSILRQILSMPRNPSSAPELVSPRQSHEPQDPKSAYGLCPTCGHTLLLRHGKFGDFIGCEKFPDCRYTSSVFEHSGKLSELSDSTARRYAEISTTQDRDNPSVEVSIKTGPAVLPTFNQDLSQTLKKPRRYMNKKVLQEEYSQEKLLKEEIWTSDETAAWLKISKHKLQQMRQLGTGPDFIRFGRHVRYEKDKVLEWFKKQKR